MGLLLGGSLISLFELIDFIIYQLCMSNGKSVKEGKADPDF